MKTTYTVKITYKSLYNDPFDHVEYFEFTIPTTTDVHVKEYFLETHKGSHSAELVDYDSWEFDIVKKGDSV